MFFNVKDKFQEIFSTKIFKNHAHSQKPCTVSNFTCISMFIQLHLKRTISIPRKNHRIYFFNRLLNQKSNACQIRELVMNHGIKKLFDSYLRTLKSWFLFVYEDCWWCWWSYVLMRFISRKSTRKCQNMKLSLRGFVIFIWLRFLILWILLVYNFHFFKLLSFVNFANL